MNNHPFPLVRLAVRRARWLAEVAAALDQADKVTRQLCQYSPGSQETIVLRARILALRTEIDSVRRGQRPANDDLHPERFG